MNAKKILSTMALMLSAASAASAQTATQVVTFQVDAINQIAFTGSPSLVINTATTVVTFLMVFLIQNTQNRDSQAIHTKLDELLVATQGARNSIAIAEELSDEEFLSRRNCMGAIGIPRKARDDSEEA